MKNKMKNPMTFLFVVLGIVICFMVMNSPNVVLAETPAGIEFNKTKDSSTTSSSNSSEKTEPSIPSKPTIKKGGTLPMTGELLQPIIFLLMGWLLLVVILSIYFSKREKKEGAS